MEGCMLSRLYTEESTMTWMSLSRERTRAPVRNAPRLQRHKKMMACFIHEAPSRAYLVHGNDRVEYPGKQVILARSVLCTVSNQFSQTGYSRLHILPTVSTVLCAQKRPKRGQLPVNQADLRGHRDSGTRLRTQIRKIGICAPKRKS